MGWGLLAACPLVLVLLYGTGAHRWVEVVQWWSEEPVRLGEVVGQLVEEGASYPTDTTFGADPFDLAGAPLRETPSEVGALLCSSGPDRTWDGGEPIDRFTGLGDVCIRLTTGPR